MHIYQADISRWGCWISLGSMLDLSWAIMSWPPGGNVSPSRLSFQNKNSVITFIIPFCNRLQNYHSKTKIPSQRKEHEITVELQVVGILDREGGQVVCLSQVWFIWGKSCRFEMRQSCPIISNDWSPPSSFTRRAPPSTSSLSPSLNHSLPYGGTSRIRLEAIFLCRW